MKDFFYLNEEDFVIYKKLSALCNEYYGNISLSEKVILVTKCSLVTDLLTKLDDGLTKFITYDGQTHFETSRDWPSYTSYLKRIIMVCRDITIDLKTALPVEKESIMFHRMTSYFLFLEAMLCFNAAICVKFAENNSHEVCLLIETSRNNIDIITKEHLDYTEHSDVLFLELIKKLFETIKNSQDTELPEQSLSELSSSPSSDTFFDFIANAIGAVDLNLGYEKETSPDIELSPSFLAAMLPYQPFTRDRSFNVYPSDKQVKRLK